jgi:hypothetical protein
MQIQSQPEWNKPRFQNAHPGLAFSPAFVNGFTTRPVGPALPMSGEDIKLDKPKEKPGNVPPKTPPQDAFYSERRQGHGNASTWMSMYKFCGPLAAGIFYGAMFGSPIWFAAGISLVVSSLQAGTALKIHKEDTPLARNIVRTTRKLMGRENDHSAAGKEWSMVPVWGAICFMAGLVEAFLNHLFAHKVKHQKQEDLAKAKGFFGPMHRLQARGMDLVEKGRKFLTEGKLKAWLPKFAEEWPKALMERFGKNGQGKAKWGYLVGMGFTSISGMLQSASAAKIQEHLDDKTARKASQNGTDNQPDGKKSENASAAQGGTDSELNGAVKSTDENGQPIKKPDAADPKTEKPDHANANRLQKPASKKASKSNKKTESQNRPDAGSVANQPAPRPEKAPEQPFSQFSPQNSPQPSSQTSQQNSQWNQPVAGQSVTSVNATTPSSFNKDAGSSAPWNPANPFSIATQGASQVQQPWSAFPFPLTVR